MSWSKSQSPLNIISIRKDVRNILVSKKAGWRNGKAMNHYSQQQQPTKRNQKETSEEITKTTDGAITEIGSHTQICSNSQEADSPKNKSLKDSAYAVEEKIEIDELSPFIECAHRYLQIAFAEDLYLYCQTNSINFEELRAALNTKWNVNVVDPGEISAYNLLRKDSKMLLNSTYKSMGSKIIDAAFNVDHEYRKKRKTIDITNDDDILFQLYMKKEGWQFIQNREQIANKQGISLLSEACLVYQKIQSIFTVSIMSNKNNINNNNQHLTAFPRCRHSRTDFRRLH